MFETTDFLFTAETTPDVTTDLAGSCLLYTSDAADE